MMSVIVFFSLLRQNLTQTGVLPGFQLPACNLLSFLELDLSREEVKHVMDFHYWQGDVEWLIVKKKPKKAYFLCAEP